MSNGATRLGMATLAAMTPAVLGAMALARVLVSNRGSFPAGVFVLGLLCGAVMLFVARSRAWHVVGVSAVVGLVAVALTFVFNAKWNTEHHAAAQLEAAHNVEPDVAMMQAKTMFANASLWELMRANWHPIWLLAALAAALGAGLTIKSHYIGKLLRVPDKPSDEINSQSATEDKSHDGL
jgi:hypothetical protein